MRIPFIPLRGFSAVTHVFFAVDVMCDTEISVFRTRIREICSSHPGKTENLKLLMRKKKWSRKEKDAVLECLSELLLDKDCTLQVAAEFRVLLLDLIHRSAIRLKHNSQKFMEGHEKFAVALTKLTTFIPNISKLCVGYFSDHPEVFSRLSKTQCSLDEPKSKKSRKEVEVKISDEDIAESAFQLLSLAPNLYSKVWDWVPFLQYLSNSNPKIRWYACQCLRLLWNLNATESSQLISKYITEKDLRSLTIQCDHTLVKIMRKQQLEQLSCRGMLSSGCKTSDLNCDLIKDDLVSSVVSVSGILVSAAKHHESCNGSLVNVESTRRNLQCLALAVNAGMSVLLRGPVGCGKTALVEHLAQLTGRGEQPNLLKVQLGDQTDSKVLLGTYHCTDIPGEFVWRPGTLTQAVLHGYWILLEDIDYAPMDVISVLVPLLESRSLTIPGHGDVIRAHPEFHLFATQRLVDGSDGLYRSNPSSTALLDNLWTVISVEPLSWTELKEIIVTKWPGLTPVADRLLQLYFLLSSGKHSSSSLHFEDLDEVPQSDEVLEVIRQSFIHDSRLISTRDLVKWCSRISHYNHLGRNPDAAILAYHDAFDCFCGNISTLKKRVAVAEAIGACMNILKTKAEFYCAKYKPSVKIGLSGFSVGRALLPHSTSPFSSSLRNTNQTFCYTRPAAALLEMIAVAVRNVEPVLLVGETGTGKTSTVQYLAAQTGHKLIVINMSQHTDSTDLLGGFKPVELKFVINPVRREFEDLFCQTFSRVQNAGFLNHVMTCYNQQRWSDLFALLLHTVPPAIKRLTTAKSNALLVEKWKKIQERLLQLRPHIRNPDSVLAFSFIEGTLVKALQSGDWVLLDEINLASAETLECLGGLLEGSTGSVLLLERGDKKTISRSSEFRLFACMNPATDVGKKDLPTGLRNRFTEFFVDDLEDEMDLKILVQHYLQALSIPSQQLDGIVKFYLSARSSAATTLIDGTGRRPHYSLRTLCRALSFASRNPCGSVSRSLYEAFCMSFLTQLDRKSHPIVEQMVVKCILSQQNVKGLLTAALPEPVAAKCVNIEGYWVPVGTRKQVISDSYILTPSVRLNLKDLARIVAAGKHPVLLQGETSVGKTSMIKWLADASGNQCVRINNHEHTDLQEYVGSYAADATGKLVFVEGVLVDAMRKGYWIILDELNLAPTDVLEALNRVLDDNRELFIPETQETVKAHPRFLLFATQNPPGLYGGRKVLSRAFRNRFVELHFSEISPGELETILHRRCALAMSHCKKLVCVLAELQTQRRGSGIFAGKQGFITLRDLFRWAERYRMSCASTTDKFYDWDQHLADEGYLLLAGRVRRADEVEIIVKALKKHLKRDVDPERLFTLNDNTSPNTKSILERIVSHQLPVGFQHLVWTLNLRRLATLVGRALEFNEPVLLVGDTGCGKTTVCQLFAALNGQRLYTVNCHMHTEGMDFLGGLRPVRHRQMEDVGDEDANVVPKLFQWVDGPLVMAMNEGAVFLADEISLADDSVLERLNSLLEPERTLMLAEKGSGGGGEGLDACHVEMVVADDKFRFVGTMNPGGDYGKKELSPALRNRFTEIWCPVTSNDDDLVQIVERNLVGVQLHGVDDGTSGIGRAMIDFLNWFGNNDIAKRCTVSIRDVLSWVDFINTCSSGANAGALDPAVAYIHGACLVFLDSLGTGLTSYTDTLQAASTRDSSLSFLKSQVGKDFSALTDEVAAGTSVYSEEDKFGISPFFIKKGPEAGSDTRTSFSWQSPTTYSNAVRILRALQLSKPILLEGSPGVGKTSMVTAIAKAAGHKLIRINLSDQTDVSDLFGADLPVEGGTGGEFSWHDGPLLQALKAGHWVVLDELNLASQSVLEGLNACLDHRGEVFVPELGMTFSVNRENTRIFACQNPHNQGGARKGLPRSFLNRFTQVNVMQMSSVDLEFVTCTMYPKIPKDIINKMVMFNDKLYRETTVDGSWGVRGSPWEFNLRDLFRWCDAMIAHQKNPDWFPGEFVSLIYSDRMRTLEDKEHVSTVYSSIFGSSTLYRSPLSISITCQWTQLGLSMIKVDQKDCGPSKHYDRLLLLPYQLPALQSLLTCLKMNWMAILVGASSSGKTTLAHVLAAITGNSISVLNMNSAMDTTELLGGFEQADVHRHLEAVSDAVRCAVQSRIKFALINCLPTKTDQHLSAIKELWQAWTSFLRQSQTGNDVEGTGEEVPRFIAKLVRLREVVAILEKQDVHSDLNDVKAKLSLLEGAVESCGTTVNQGGQFEWIDSVIINALRSGSLLLIDNVNFCSPSVLDRLNGLLEPGGVLTVNERGVRDGEPVTIRPHPRFRLILSMDPRNGEISRAMRNRGVEIFVPGKDEGSGMNWVEVSAVLEQIGLISPLAQSTLLRLHDRINDPVVGCRKPFLANLWRAARLCVQRIDEGHDVCSALKHSVRDVYISGQASRQTKQSCIAAVDETLSTVEEELLRAPLTPMIPCPYITISELGQHPMFAVVKMDTSIATFALERLIFGEVFRLGLNENFAPRDVDAAVCFQAANLICLRRSSKLDWKFRLDWLEKVRQELIDQSQDHSRDILPAKSAAQFLGAIGQAAECLFSSQIFQALQEKIVTCFDIDLDTCAQLGFDLRWNLDLVQILTRQSNNALNMEELVWLTNRCCLLLSFHDQRIKMLRCLQETSLEVKVNRKLIGNFSILQQSYLFQKGVLGVDSLPHEIIGHILSFFQLVFSNFEQHLYECGPCTDNRVQQINEALNWIWLFWTACSQCTLKKGIAAELSKLALHWNWVYEKALPVIFVAENNPKKRFPPQLEVSVDKINCLLSAVGGQHGKLAVKIRKAMKHPNAFTTEDDAVLNDKIDTLSEALTVWSTDKFRDKNSMQNIVRQQTSQIKRDFWRRLLKLCESIETRDVPTSELYEAVDDLEREMRDEGLIDGDRNTACDTGNLSLPLDACYDVQLWPVLEFFGIVQEKLCLRVALGKGASVAGDSGNFSWHASEKCNIHPAHLSVLKRICAMEEQDEKPHLLMYSMQVFHCQRLLRCPATKNSRIWLRFGEDDVEEEIREHCNNEGQAALYSPLLAYFANCVLTRSDSSKVKVKGNAHCMLPMNLLLGSCTEKSMQIKRLCALTWKNGEMLSESRFSTMKNDSHSMLSVFTLLVNSLCSVINRRIIDVGKGDVFEKTRNALRCAAEQILKSDIIPSVISDAMTLCCSVVSELLGEISGSSVETAVGCRTTQRLIGQAWVYIGWMQATLLAPLGIFDPVQKAALKLECTKNEIAQSRIEFMLYNQMMFIATGKELKSHDLNQLHPHIKLCQSKLTKLNERIEHLEQNQAIRPSPPMFEKLRKDMDHYVTTIGSLNTVFSLLNRLVKCAKEGCKGTDGTLEQEASWQHSQEAFIKKMLGTYPWYKDLMIPFAAAVGQISIGMKMVARVAQVTHVQDVVLRLKEPGQLNSLVVNLLKFPHVSRSHPTSLSLAFTLSCPSSTGDVIKKVFNSAKVPSDGSVQSVKILKSCVLGILNHTAQLGTLSDSAFQCVEQVLGVFVATWQKAEETKRKREAEKESLYEYKEQTHGEIVNEEEEVKRYIAENFPSYEEEFEDLNMMSSLEKPKKLVSNEKDSDCYAESISDSQLEIICTAHQQLMVASTQTRWFTSKEKLKADYLSAFIPRQQVASEILANFAYILDSSIDAQAVGAHLMIGAMMLKLLQSKSNESSPLIVNEARPYDIYHSPNVGEVFRCKIVLQELSQRINEILEEWPSQPILVEILKVIERLQSFPITSPLMTFVTGFEMLLAKSQEWETNAHKGISIAAHLATITKLIISWRKFELNCWSSCLDSVAFRERQHVAKWWFHIYSATKSYLESADENVSIGDIIKSLKEFMENGPVGQYEPRLRILLAFHCHLTHLNKSPRRDELVNVFWNLYVYYQEFLETILQAVTNIRKPIEKSVKDLVKISRWSNLNFWSVKVSVEKTHRALFKHSKEFQKVLKQQVLSYIVDNDLTSQSLKESSDRNEKTVNPSLYLSAKCQNVTAGEFDEGIWVRYSHLQKKTRILCLQIFKQDYLRNIEALDDFTGEIISGVHELQKLDVTKNADKEKQKKEAKNIHLRKRRALADLFKTLQHIGLSYRKGLLWWKSGEGENAAILLQPVDFSTLKDDQQYRSVDAALCDSWVGCQKYFCKMLARMGLLQTVMKSPSKELGLANIQRCMGFTAHLYKFTISQRKMIAGVDEKFRDLRRIAGSLIVEASGSLPAFPPQKCLPQLFNDTRDLLCSLVEGLSQFLLVLHACPENTEECLSLDTSLSSPFAVMDLGDNLWKKITEDLEATISRCNEINSWLLRPRFSDRLSTTEVFSWKCVRSLCKAHDALVEISLNIVPEELEGCRHPLLECLHLLKCNVLAVTERFKEWQGKNTNDKIEIVGSIDATKESRAIEMERTSETLLTKTLVSIQELFKKVQVANNEKDNHGDQETPAKDDDGDDQKEDIAERPELPKALVTSTLQESLQDDIAKLNITFVHSGMMKLISLWKEIQTDDDMGDKEKETSTRILLRIVPVMDQYINLVNYFLMNLTKAHRSSCKLTTVLLGIFTELANKGFCLPPEMSDEMQKEGASEFQDMEAGGFGDGEGAKDVSEKIDNEDQLQEAQQEGAEKKEDDAGPKPDLKDEEHGIEMSDDFDGKLHDPEEKEDNSEGEESEEEKEEELEKEMGDLDDEADKLDEKIWGDDEEDEDEDDEQQEGKEDDYGPGAGGDESQLVAKDDNKDQREGADDKNNFDKGDKEEPEINPMDERDYEEEFPNKSQKNKDKEEEPEAFELPEDLKLDDGDEDAGEDENAEDPMDIDKDDALEVDDENVDVPEGPEGDDVMDEENKTAEDGNDEAQENLEEGNEEELQNKERDETCDDEGAEEPEEDENGHVEEKVLPSENDPSEQTAQPADEDNKLSSCDNAIGNEEKQEREMDKVQDLDKNNEGVGQARADNEEGHTGANSAESMKEGKQDAKRRPPKRKPGDMDDKRSLGSDEMKTRKHLKMDDRSEDLKEDANDKSKEKKEETEDGQTFQHIREETKEQSETQVLDSATEEQAKQQVAQNFAESEAEDDDDLDDVQMMDDEPKPEVENVERLPSKGNEGERSNKDESKDEFFDSLREEARIEGEKIATETVARGNESSIHTKVELLTASAPVDVEELRRELEENVTRWRREGLAVGGEASASELMAWRKYEAVVGNLAQELCEQLRLVMQPTQAAKLRGDYRTGKRLNMRKVIPYVASQFRKDKIWLRRTRPSKRDYQILLAMDDSSSMADNHSRQLAFESLALVGRALTLLEAGKLGIASFGEDVQVLHHLHEPFTEQAGARVLRQLSFEQGKTRVARLLDTATSLLLSAKTSSRSGGKGDGSVSVLDTAQLLVIISDGRGLFNEGAETLKRSVRKTYDAGVFVVFVVIDSPTNKDSIFDIRVPIFKGAGQLPEIKSYMDDFPFPFYVVLKDLNTLPLVLSSALRQWFELVVSTER